MLLGCYLYFSLCSVSLVMGLGGGGGWGWGGGDVRKWDHSYNNVENWVRHILFLRKKGAYRIPGSTEKWGYSGRTSLLCHL